MPCQRDEIISLVVTTDGTDASMEALIRTAASVYDQTYDKIELLVVSFGKAAARAEAVLSRLQPRESGIGTRVLGEVYSNAAAARNAGIREALGSRIQFLEAGDEIDSFMAEKLYFTAKWNAAPLALCGIAVRDETGHIELIRPETTLTTDRTTFLNTLFAQSARSGLLQAGANQMFSTSVLRARGLLFDEKLAKGAAYAVFFMQYLQECDSICLLRPALVGLFAPESEIYLNEASAFALLAAYDALFDASDPNDDAVDEMNNVLLEQLLFCLETYGIEELEGQIDAETALKRIEAFAGKAAFQTLLTQTIPDSIWKKLSAGLLRAKKWNWYHRVLSIKLRLNSDAGGTHRQLAEQAEEAPAVSAAGQEPAEIQQHKDEKSVSQETEQEESCRKEEKEENGKF